MIIGRREDYAEPVEDSFVELGVDWTVQFAADASSALHLAQQQLPDVVVCELHPLGMEGTALLERIRKRVPKAVCIMLLEAEQSAQAMRLLNHADRILHKPLQAAELIEAVDGISELRELLDSAELKHAIGRIDRLPPPPDLYLALSRAVADPDVSLSHLASLVSQDPGTAAKLLRICNSAYFSGGRVISSVRGAVIRLGQQELRRIVLASEVYRDLPGGIDREAMRQRSLLASQLAGRIIDNANAEMATTAALLAEVGLLLPGVRKPDANGQWVGQGPHYAEAGAYLLGMWGLPMPIVEAVAQHCGPQRQRERGFGISGAVYVACALAAGREIDSGFLERHGVADRLPAWRQLALQLGGQLAERVALDAPAAAQAPSEARQRQAAEDLLGAYPGAGFEHGGTRFVVLGVRLNDALGAQTVEAALTLERYDALALGLCAERLEHDSEAACGRFDWLRGAAGWQRLGRAALAASERRIEAQCGQGSSAFYRAASEVAHRRKLPVWLLDLDLTELLARVAEPLSWPARWSLSRRARITAVGAALDEATVEDGDPVWLTFGHIPALRSLLLEQRPALMLAKLRRAAAEARARRVLVLLPALHIDALRGPAEGAASEALG